MTDPPGRRMWKNTPLVPEWVVGGGNTGIECSITKQNYILRIAIKSLEKTRLYKKVAGHKLK